MKFSLFVFDLSGTIIDNKCLGPLHFMRKAFKKEGFDVHEDYIIRDMGNAKRKHVALILQNLFGL